ncbi:hypothetical protein M2317_003121 [Microbacterium sp. ZKA21]|uniref:hypothetical protein n=1 Tax=Microbacterium sp. ZKA21 TaxID=3381694 RepID=UPI003D21878D
MKRLSFVVALTAVALGLAGCQSTPEPPDADAVSSWMQEQSASDRPDSLATMAGAPTIASSSPSAEDAEGIAVDFASAVNVTAVEFSCFGEERMSVSVEVRGAAETRSTGADDLVCADSPHLLTHALEDALRVDATSTSEYGLGAWSVVVLGDEQ